MPSTRKIAERAHVSIGTVSRVLNNKDGVSDDTRRRVLEVAQELNYAPTKRLPLPVVSTTHIGLLVRPLGENLMASPFYADVYHGVEQICSELRINLSFSSVDSVEGRVRNLPTLVDDERIGGLILVGAMAPSVVAHLAAESRLPIVLIDNWFPDCRWDSVMLDNAGGVAQATERLLDLGHTRVLFVSGPDHPSVVERRNGYLEVMARRNLPPQVLYMPDLGIGEGDGAAEQVVATLPETTAVICSNDMQAFGMMRRLAQLGLRIPHDMSVIGFDDVSMATLTFPPLSTINVDRIAFGRLAVELLISRVQAPTRPPVRLTMAVTFAARASVGPPRPHTLAAARVNATARDSAANRRDRANTRDNAANRNSATNR
jgi:DNA-binding LacI/PurR family transcriptional regulator